MLVLVAVPIGTGCFVWPLNGTGDVVVGILCAVNERWLDVVGDGDMAITFFPYEDLLPTPPPAFMNASL